MSLRPSAPLLLALLAACAPSRGGGDDDDAGPSPFGALDTDGDGDLDGDDLGSDPAANTAILAVDLPDGATSSEGTAALRPGGEGAWLLSLEWGADPAWLLELAFANAAGELPSVQTGLVDYASANEQSAVGAYAWSTDPGGSVAIEAVDADAAGAVGITGRLDGTLELDVLDLSTEQPTGEVITVRGFAFFVAY